MRILKWSLPTAALLLTSLAAWNGAGAQVAPASIGGRPSLYAGGYYSNFDSDFQQPRLSGLGVYVDWNLFGKLGVEGEARFLRLDQLNSFHSDHYLVGPKYTLRYGRFHPYVKFLLGAGEVNYPYSLANGGYFAMAPGGGLDYQLSHHFNARGDYEYHFWPTAPGLPGMQSNGLTPNGFSVGIGYRIF